MWNCVVVEIFNHRASLLPVKRSINKLKNKYQTSARRVTANGLAGRRFKTPITGCNCARSAPRVDDLFWIVCLFPIVSRLLESKGKGRNDDGGHEWPQIVIKRFELDLL